MTCEPSCRYRGRSRHDVSRRAVLLGSGLPLDDRDELDVARLAVVAQEAVELAAVIAVGGVHGRQRVPVDLGVAQVVEAAHHIGERALAALVDAICVVQRLRPVDRDADEHAVVLEERRPLLVDQRAVRLDRVARPLARAQVLVRELDRAAEELDAHQRRLAALPGDRHLRHGCMCLDQLSDVRLEQLIRHPEARAGVEHLLREEEAVRAVEVADRPRRLCEQVERARRGRGWRAAGGELCQVADHLLTLPPGARARITPTGRPRRCGAI